MAWLSGFRNTTTIPAGIVVVQVMFQVFILYFQFAFRMIAEGVALVQRLMDEVDKERATANLLEGRGCTQPENVPVFADPIQVVFPFGRGLV